VHTAVAVIHASTTVVDQLHAVVASWQASLTMLPIALNACATADITSGGNLPARALKKMVKDQ
jgi:hypothetical protein